MRFETETGKQSDGQTYRQTRQRQKRESRKRIREGGERWEYEVKITAMYNYEFYMISVEVIPSPAR